MTSVDPPLPPVISCHFLADPLPPRDDVICDRPLIKLILIIPDNISIPQRLILFQHQMYTACIRGNHIFQVQQDNIWSIKHLQRHRLIQVYHLLNKIYPIIHVDLIYLHRKKNE